MNAIRRTLAAIALAATAGTTVATAVPANAMVPHKSCLFTGITLAAQGPNRVGGGCYTKLGQVHVYFEDAQGYWYGVNVKANRAGKIGPVTAPGWCINFVAAAARDVTTDAYVQIPVDMLSPCAY